MKRILLTTDFSAVSEKAVLYALNLLGNQPCEFTFLHASRSFQDDSPSDASFNYFEAFYSLSMVNMQQFIANVQQLDTLGIHTFKGLLFPTAPIEAVNFLTFQKDFDMIVIGTKRKHKGIFSGNIASSILKTSTTNAVIVPEQVDIAPLKNIVVAFDGQNTCSLEELTVLKTILQKNNATLTVLHIQKNKTQNKASFTSRINHHLFEGIELIDYPIYAKNLEDGITRYLNFNKADMLVTVTRLRSFFEGLFNRPVSSKLALNPIVPMMNIYSK